MVKEGYNKPRIRSESIEIGTYGGYDQKQVPFCAPPGIECCEI
jgi:hypothetical protein